ncbi:hypothetical protein [Dyadobacter jejuensis]|nr:hypothetical protein [Dyadobacter jejuensis]
MKDSIDSPKQELSTQKTKKEVNIGEFQFFISDIESLFGWLMAIIFTAVSLVGILLFKRYDDRLEEQARSMKKYIEETNLRTQIMKYEIYCFQNSSMMGLDQVIERFGDQIYSIRIALIAVGELYKSLNYARTSAEIRVFEQGILEYLNTIEDILPKIDSKKWTEEKIDLLRITYEQHCYFGDKDILLSLYGHEDPKIREASISVFLKLGYLTS